MTTTNSRPNILFIMADQMTPLLMGVYGHPQVKTPNLDALAQQAVRFDAAYSPCPICSPARNSLLTGKYVSTIRCYDNSTPLASDEPTLAHYLTNAGYETVASGKMHFVGPDQLHGFKHRLTTDVFPSGFNWTPNTRENEASDFADIHAEPIAIDYVSAGVRQWSMQLGFDEETHHKALEYLYSKRMKLSGTLQKPQPQRDPAPFCLMVSYTHPHEPFHVTQEMWDAYEDVTIDIPDFPEDMESEYTQLDRWLNTFHGVHRVDLKNPDNLRNMRRAYYALVTYIDKKVGELLKTLRDTGLEESTIVIFASDHGDLLGERGMVQKRAFYEWCARVPLLIYDPRKAFKNQIVRSPVNLMDLTPTLLDLAGVAQDERLDMEAQSLMPLITDKDQRTSPVFSENHTEGVYATTFMVRKGKFKYVYIHGHETQLYDMENDPAEWHNLSGTSGYQTIEADMKQALLRQFNPDRIEADVRDSLKKRHLIKTSNQRNQPPWDYTPPFDASQMYWREG